MLKILITGGAGFIGSHVAEYYAKSGEEVIVFDNLSRAEILRKSVGDLYYNLNYLRNHYNDVNVVKVTSETSLRLTRYREP